jgi:hypothetical protein
MLHCTAAFVCSDDGVAAGLAMPAGSTSSKAKACPQLQQQGTSSVLLLLLLGRS